MLVLAALGLMFLRPGLRPWLRRGEPYAAAARPRHDAGRFLLLYFGVVFVGFSIIRPGNPDGLDPVSWIWVDSTMLPAAVIAGVVLASLGRVIARRVRLPGFSPPSPV